MIPKSLLLGFLAVQAPQMTPSTRSADIAVFGGAAPATAFNGLLAGPAEARVATGVVSDDQHKFDWTQYPDGPWNDDTKIDNVMQSSGKPGVSWLYSRKDSFGNVPGAPGKQDKVFGAQGLSASQVRIWFADTTHDGVTLDIVYTYGGFAQKGDLTVAMYAGKKPVGSFQYPLKAKWNSVDIPKTVDLVELIVNSPEVGSNLLVAQVTYTE